MSMSREPEEQRDEIDRLFSSMAYTPPPQGLTGRVLAAVEARAVRRQRLAYGLLMACVSAIAFLSFLIGAGLARVGGLGLIELLMMDLDDVLDDPLDAVMAFAGETPVAEAITVLVLILLVICVARVAASSTLQRGRQAAEG